MRTHVAIYHIHVYIYIYIHGGVSRNDIAHTVRGSSSGYERERERQRESDGHRRERGQWTEIGVEIDG